MIPRGGRVAGRGLVRDQADCRGDLIRVRHRLSKLLLRHGIVYSGEAALTGKHDLRLRVEALPALSGAAKGLAFDSDYETVVAVKARRDRLDTALEKLAADSEFTPVVRRLGCLRGVGTLTGFALAVEIDDWTRFAGNTIGTFVGLTASEYSSERSRALGRSPRLLRHRPGVGGSAWSNQLAHISWFAVRRDSLIELISTLLLKLGKALRGWRASVNAGSPGEGYSERLGTRQLRPLGHRSQSNRRSSPDRSDKAPSDLQHGERSVVMALLQKHLRM